MISRSLIAPFKHVWSQDEALDRDHADFSHEEFVRTGDFKHLPVIEGRQLTIFELAQLTRRQREVVATLAQQDRLVEAAREALAYGLRGWSGWTDHDGSEVTPKFQGSDDEKRATKKTLDWIYDARLIGELGGRIIEASALRPKSGQE